MGIEFYWRNFRVEPTPNCRSGAVGLDGVDFLACPSGDDGVRALILLLILSRRSRKVWNLCVLGS